MRRREFIGGLGGAAVWPLTASAQQRAMPVIALDLCAARQKVSCQAGATHT